MAAAAAVSEAAAPQTPAPAVVDAPAVAAAAEPLDPSDPRSTPTTEGGWSETIQTVPQALIVPTAGRDMVQVGGVFDANRGFVHQAAHWRRGRALLVPMRPRKVPSIPEDTLPGRWMWGGLLLNHFGHFLTESTTRLWGLAELADRIDGLVFLHKRNAEVMGLHSGFLSLLGYDLPIRVVDKVTRVEELVVPGQGFGLGRISAGTPRVRAFFRDRFASHIPPDGPERLYISRSALGPRRGGVIGEVLIEQELARHGYDVFHPQHHSLEVQVARYRAARDIIALDGSALHLVAFCARQDQRVAMIRRRNSSISNAIGFHLHGFTGQPPQVIDAILADWVLKDKGAADRFSMGELDMPTLQAQLTAKGFIPAEDRIWPAMDAEWRDAQIGRLRDEFHKDYIALPRVSAKERRSKAP